MPLKSLWSCRAVSAMPSPAASTAWPLLQRATRTRLRWWQSARRAAHARTASDDVARVMALGGAYCSWSSSSLGTDLDDCVHRLGVFSADQVGGAANDRDTKVGPSGGQVSRGSKIHVCRVEAHDIVCRRATGAPADDEDGAPQRE